MKLLKKYRELTYTSLFCVVLIGFVFNYYLFRSTHHMMTDDLINEYCIDINEYAEVHQTLEPLMAVNSKFGEIRLVDKSCDLSRINKMIVDTLAYDHYQQEMVVYRKMEFPVSTPQQDYIVRLMLPTLDEEYLVGTILLSLIVFITLFIIFTSIVDISFTRQIFQPFNKMLELLKTYSIEKRTKIQLEKNDIDEFREMSRILTEMMDKINKGYGEMQEFLEYSSHELQTPLSIIQLKLDALCQKNSQNQEILDSVSSIQSSINRVTKFNRSLLFMAKIRNDQYTHDMQIDLKKVVLDFILQYGELLNMRNINVKFENKEKFLLNLHPILATHLVQNILTNAIKHNVADGSILISINADSLSVSNTFNGVVPVGNLFDKYRHTKERQDSNGLGMAIAKTICQKNKLDITYKVEEKVFTIIISRQKNR